MAEIRIYFEGHESLRQGFCAFFKEIYDLARARRWRVELIATHGTPAEDFAIANRTHRDAWNILLLDSESPDSGELTASLIAREGWDASHKDSIFWMVQMMEAWFHADKDALERFYGGKGFHLGALSGNPLVEQISKKDLQDGLKAATKNTKKGAYHKTKHAPGLLEEIDPNRVRRAAPHCNRFFNIVLAKLS